DGPADVGQVGRHLGAAPGVADGEAGREGDGDGDGQGDGVHPDVREEALRDRAGTGPVGRIRQPPDGRADEVHPRSSPAHGVSRRPIATRARSTARARTTDGTAPATISVGKLWREPSKRKKPRPPKRSPMIPEMTTRPIVETAARR